MSSSGTSPKMGSETPPRRPSASGRMRTSSFGQKFLPRSWSGTNDSELLGQTSQGEIVTGSAGESSAGGDSSPTLSAGQPRLSVQRRISRVVSRLSASQENSPANASPKETEEDETERRVRIARVMNKQQHRTSFHVQQFSKITVMISGSELIIEVTASRDQTIEYLARQIEADYAYKYLLQLPGARTSVTAATSPQRDPLVIGQVYDSGMLALKFEDRIADVLGFTDTVSVINAFEGESINRNMYPSEDALYTESRDGSSMASGLAGLEKTSQNELPEVEVTSADQEKQSVSSGNVPSISVVQPKEDESTGSLPVPGQGVGHKRVGSVGSSTSMYSGRSHRAPVSLSPIDDRLQSCLRNKVGLRFFSEFCIEEYTIENLLFWLDVEIFQSCRQELRDNFAKYIIVTYITSTAPLQVNISAEIREDVISNDTSDPIMFDEAQEQVYAMLKSHSFVRYEKSKKFKEYLDAKTNDRLEYQRGRISGPFVLHFLSNIETARGIIPLIETSPTHKMPSSLPFGNSDKNAKVNKAATMKFKESVLTKALTQYFPLANRILKGYFNDTNRNHWADKQKRMHPSAQYLQTIGGIGTFDSSEDFLNQHDDENAVSPTNDEDATSHGNRRKKKDKLETFFGDKLTNQQQRGQQIVTNAESGSNLGTSSETSDDDIQQPVETTNDLKANERRMLQKRTNKISRVLGESLDEKTIGLTVTYPAIQERLNAAYSSADGESLMQSDDGSIHRLGDTSSFASLGRPGTNNDTISRDGHCRDGSENESKLAQKRRLDKISSMMGQRIGVSDIQEAKASGAPPPTHPRRPLTLEEKKQFQKKASKLERILGQLPPTEALYTSLAGSMEQPAVATARRSLAGLSFMVKQARDVFDILDPLAHLTDNDAPGGTTVSRDSQVSFESQATSSINVQQVELSKESRQKRLNKLRKFFGDHISVEVVVETQLLADLERTIEEEIMDEQELEKLRRQIKNIRDDLRRRSDQFKSELDLNGAGIGESLLSQSYTLKIGGDLEEDRIPRSSAVRRQPEVDQSIRPAQAILPGEVEAEGMF
ncbi:hypothetical protein DFS34DRAFT_695430 [Phlyctochytrium arcticum]|nr:hypothetical protein DFS34DRAFT_695430 [Phlyctochytrium arcticum]